MKNNGFYKEGFRYAMGNAKSLLATAKSAANLNNYGLGTSLCILSTEEYIKAVFILQQGVDLKNKVSDFEKVFRNHKIKHEYLDEFVKQMDRFRCELLIEYRSHFLNRQSRRRFAKSNPKAQATVDWAEKHFKSVEEMLDIIDWFGNANDQKNKGLYVDIRNNEWIVPNKTDKNTFDIAYQNAKDICA